jgi:hypothetical protein
MKKNIVKETPFYKTGKNIKEVIPPNFKNIQERTNLIPPVDFKRDYEPLVRPYEIFPEWDEKEANNFDFQLFNIYSPFVDPFTEKIYLPNSLQNEANPEMKWLRPSEYIMEHILDKEIIKKYPNRNNLKLRSQIKKSYQCELANECLIVEKSKKSSKRVSIDYLQMEDNHEDEKDYVSTNYLLFKHFYSILSNQPEIRLVPLKDREETDDEFESRIKFEEEKLKLQEKKTMTNNINKSPQTKSRKITIVEEKKPEKIFIKETFPNNIDMAHKYNDYTKWVGSILQMILDRNILDPYVNIFLFN